MLPFPVIALLAAALSGAAIAPPATAPDAGADGRTEAPRTIELHVGIPDWVTIGLAHKDLIARFPRAEVNPFAGQDDAYTVKISGAGISAMVLGASPETLAVASLGFNLDGDYQGVAEGNFRTDRGLRKGSTVNDLLSAYGKPAEIVSDRTARRALRRRPDFSEEEVPQLYQYRSDDGSVTTSFVVQDNRVVRVVINALEPLRNHIVKRKPPE